MEPPGFHWSLHILYVTARHHHNMRLITNGQQDLSTRLGELDAIDPLWGLADNVDAALKIKLA